MRVAFLGGGTIARLVLQHARSGGIPGVEFVAIAGRGPASRGTSLAAEFSIPYTVGRQGLMGLRPDAIVEAA